MKPLFQSAGLTIPTPMQIYFCDKPLTSITSDQDIKLINTEEIVKKFREHRKLKSFEWISDIMVPNHITLTKEDKETLQLLHKERISSEHFVICKMPDVGYGTYNRLPIKKGSIVIYESEMIETTDHDKWLGNGYYYIALATNGKKSVYDARAQCGFGAVLQDLHDKTDPTLSEPVDEANFECRAISLSNVVVHYLIATQDIPAYSHCGYHYGHAYWRNHQQKNVSKYFFKNDGTVFAVRRPRSYHDLGTESTPAHHQLKSFNDDMLKQLAGKVSTLIKSGFITLEQWLINAATEGDPLQLTVLLKYFNPTEAEREAALEAANNEETANLIKSCSNSTSHSLGLTK